MIQIDERLFQQEWYLDLDIEARWLYLYLLSIADKKTGIFEINMRTINFYANASKKYTKEDLLTIFGDRVRMIPNHESTAIFPKFIRTNWAKEGVLDMRSRLFQSIISALNKFGLTLEDINEWTGDNLVCINMREEPKQTSSVEAEDSSDDTSEVDELFSRFWQAYPSTKRRVDKQGCLKKWRSIFTPTKDKSSLFSSVMEGLERWKQSDEWRRGYEPLTHKFLNQRYWETDPTKGVNNETRTNIKQSENAISTEQYAGLF